MTDITTSRNISGIAPVSPFGGIRPVCVPIELDSSFSDEVSGRFSKRVNSLWDRLGLVFFIEEQQAPVRDSKQIVVNNFSSQIIFQLFGNKNTRRLVVKDQPGFVYLDNICKRHESLQNRLSERISKEIAARISYNDRLAQQVKVLYEALGDSDKTDCPSQLLVVTLERLLSQKTSHTHITDTEQTLIKRLQKVLSVSEDAAEKQMADKLIEAISRSDTSHRRGEILSVLSDHAANTRDSALQRKAAELFINAADGAKSTDAVKNSLTQTIDRLHRVIYDEGSDTYAADVSADITGHPSDMRGNGRGRLSGSITPMFSQYDITRTVTELLLSAADAVGTDKSLAAGQRIAASFGGKSVEEIEKHIRRAYTGIASNATHNTAQVLSAANGVVLSLLTKGETELSSQIGNAIVTQPAASASPYIGTNAVTSDKTAQGAALSTYFSDLTAGAEQFYAISSDVAQAVSYRDIKRAVSQLMGNHTPQDMSAALNRVPITKKATVFPNITINNENKYSDTANTAYSEFNYTSHLSDAPFMQNFEVDASAHTVQQGDNIRNIVSSGTVLPTQQDGYTLNKAGDVYYAESHQSGDVNNISTATSIQNISNSVQQGDNIRNVVSSGTVLPTQQDGYTLNKAGDVYYAESHQSGDVNSISTATHIENISNSVQQGDNIRNITASGTVLPTQQGGYTLNKAGDVYYAESHQSGDVSNISTATSIQNISNSVQQGDNIRNITASGTVLPTQQDGYTLNKAGDVYYAESHQSGDVNSISTANHIQNINNSVQQGDDIRNITASGTVLPTQQDGYTLNKAGDVYFAADRQQAENSGGITPAQTGSYRSKLDSKTLAALDEMIKSAGIKTNVRSISDDINERYTVSEARSDAVYEYAHPESADGTDKHRAGGTSARVRRPVLDVGANDRLQLNQLRTAAVMRRGIGLTLTNNSAHISGMIEHLSEDTSQAARGGTVNSGFSYRTIDSGENMVMLIPPTEMDRYQAENGYAKQMPPIELKQKAEAVQPQAQPQGKQKAVNVKNEPVTVKTMGSIEGMSREEISRLVDKVYEQLEARLLRERRRRGL